MPTLDKLMLTEEYQPPAAGTMPALPDGLNLPATRTAVSPGSPIQWQETRGEFTTVRGGMVLSLGMRARSVWVVPNTPRPGEGYAVMVHDVTGKDTSDARRTVGAADDFWSTEEFQHPHTLLPRAWLRCDQVFNQAGGLDHETLTLHAQDPSCVCAHVRFPGQTFKPGTAEPAETVYVFQGRFLHPLSVLPMDPGSFTALAGTRYVWLGRCFAYRAERGRPVAILPDEVPAP